MLQQKGILVLPEDAVVGEAFQNKEVVTSLCHNLFINFHYFDFVLMPIDRSSIQQ